MFYNYAKMNDITRIAFIKRNDNKKFTAFKNCKLCGNVNLLQ